MRSAIFFIFLLSFLSIDLFCQLLPGAELVKKNGISRIIARSTINRNGYEIIDYTFDSSGALSQTNSIYIEKGSFDTFSNKVYYHIGKNDSIVDSIVTIQKGFYSRIPIGRKKIYVYDSLRRMIRDDNVVYNYFNVKDKCFQVRTIRKHAESQDGKTYCGLGQLTPDSIRIDTFAFTERKAGYFGNEEIIADTIKKRDTTIVTTRTSSYGIIDRIYFLEGLACKWENYVFLRFDPANQVFDKKKEIYELEVIRDF